VLAIVLRDQPALAAHLRVIETFGPATIQRFVVARWLPERLRAELFDVLVEMGEDPAARIALAHGFIKRFVPMADSAYDDIRHMLAAAEATGLLALR
jgi:phosphonate transport system substrate-binding protein